MRTYPCYLFTLLALLSVNVCYGLEKLEPSGDDRTGRPNIVVILADDMGYGDIGAYNEKSLIPTPNLDDMAAAGMRFTDAHTPSSVCTPSRYSLLTGRYAWRTHLKTGVLWGYSPLLIEPGRETIASMLRKQGYHTAGIGKWHLGLGNGEPSYYGVPVTEGESPAVDSKRLRPGPNEVGFDYFFGTPASLDMKPYVYIENGQPLTPMTGKLVEASERRRGGGGGMWRKGEIAEGFDHQKVLPTLTEKAVHYIHTRGQSDGEPFFLYFSLTAPHTPWLPSEAFIGKSEAGYYGDFNVQVDHVVGQVYNALESAGVAENTLVVFTSDNGANWLTVDIEKYGHYANGSLRGQKADIYEGGHRVPLLFTWPNHIPQNTVSDQPATLADLMATFATLTDVALADTSAPDSVDISPVLLGGAAKVTREPLIHHSVDGMFAIREGEWKLVEGLGSGGFTAPVREKATEDGVKVQLYNLAQDPGETKNVAAKHPKIVAQLQSKLDHIRSNEYR
ncbi:sulfatase family protein [Gilvimarinus sp. 1_MG-2023]|uniref:sulfatase family protein n=1 Tax=Gilvimarinus sp. 1_MG-2023 TaxID=3062638 RepID=UPI0026E25A70|nr:arylsulfatase [Gilvimarinus sp. 1_MG-2023]MDO6748360.1 arylsulfatase [Gilvimarinus sp. 1_MG-2023]